MTGLYQSELIFYIGLTVMAIAVMMFIVSLIILKISRKKLNRTLENEYGKKRTNLR